MRKGYRWIVSAMGAVCLFLAQASGSEAPSEFGLLKQFCSERPTNLVVSFTDEHESAFLPSGGLVHTDKWGGAAIIPRNMRHYVTYMRVETNQMLAISMAPLDQGFKLGAGFSASGFFMGTNWNLTPVAQLHYAIPTPADEAQSGERNPLSRRPGYTMLALLLSFGINVEPGSVVWNGGAFTGRTWSDPFLLERGFKTRQLLGRVSLSNGVPTAATYRVEGGGRAAVSYEYTRKFELPFPSDIIITKFKLHQDGHEVVTVRETFEVVDARATITEGDTRQLAPKYFAEKSGQPVQEFLLSKGRAVAGMRKGAWLFDKSTPKTHTTARAVFVSLLLVVGCAPLAVVVWRHMGRRRTGR